MTDYLAFTNARLVDPLRGTDSIGSMIVEDGIILDHGTSLFAEGLSENAEVVDCNGCVLAPGLIDVAVSTGEPGAEHKETIHTATRAAAAGGITTIVTMPDTKPVIDDVALVQFIMRQAAENGIVNVLPMASLTRDLEGNQMTEIGLLAKAGAVAFTDGYKSVANSRLMRRALSYASNFGALIAHHTEVAELSESSVMTEGEIATRLGLEGAPTVSEAIMLDRDLRLLQSLNGARYHAASISTAASVAAVRQAKLDNQTVSAGVAPYHFALNEAEIIDYRTYAKLSPPLRSETDRLAVVEGIKDGTIEVIASHHRPEPQENKRLPFAQAKPGAVGLETLLSVALSLYQNNDMELINVIYCLTAGPAKVFGISKGTIEPGKSADLVLFDPDLPWRVDSELFTSKCKNSPFDKRPLQGRVLRTIVGGRTVFPFTK